MIMTKKAINFLLLISIIVWPLKGFITVEGDALRDKKEEYSYKIDCYLQNAIKERSAKYHVMVWLRDIDMQGVYKKTEKAVGYSFLELEENEKNILGKETKDTGRVKELQKRVNDYVLTERKISAEEYAAHNKMIISQYKNIEIEYVSKYAPVFIAWLSEEQIYILCENEDILEIGLYEEEDYYDTAIDDIHLINSRNMLDSLASVDTSYLDYISANSMHAAGITGDGVKVGLFDIYKVKKSDHSELSQSTIYQTGTGGVASNTNNHSSQMARIICGTYGVAPDCTLYSASYQGGTCSGIEDLISQGVSVINCSFGVNRVSGESLYNDAYSSREKWVDHISVSHSVIVVTCAGNIKKGATGATQRIGDFGLAYNVITVANVDHLSNTVGNTSCYDNGDGAQKPDVAAPGNRVLLFASSGGGGTSAATAVVTGAIAMLLESKPTLVNYPRVIKAIIIAGCDKIAGSSTISSGYNAKQGAGVINVSKAISISNNGQYFSGNFTGYSNNTYTRTVASGASITSIAFVGENMNVTTVNHTNIGDISPQAMPIMGLTVKKTDGTVLGSSYMSPSSVQLVRCAYNSTIKIQISASNVGRGLPWAVAWY